MPGSSKQRLWQLLSLISVCAQTWKSQVKAQVSSSYATPRIAEIVVEKPEDRKPEAWATF